MAVADAQVNVADPLVDVSSPLSAMTRNQAGVPDRSRLRSI
jgi:hypothetical protein